MLPNDYKHMIANGGLILNIFTMCCLFLTYFVFFPKIVKFIKKNLIFSVPFIIVLFATIINDGEVSSAAYNFVFLFIFYFIGAFFKEYKYKFLKTAEILSFAILAINTFVMVFHGQPLSYSATAGRVFFIFEGSMVKLMACNMLLFFVNKRLKLTRFAILHYIVYFFSFYCITFSSTGFYSLLFMFIFMLFVSVRNQIGNVFKMIAIYISILCIINLLVVFDLLSPFLSNLFNKSETLSGRTEIWKTAIGVVKNNLLIGIGEYNSNYFIEISGVRGATHAHNQILQVLLNSGVVGFSIYAYFAVKLMGLRKIISNNVIVVYYLIYLFTILLMCVTSLPFDNFFYLSVLIVVNYMKWNMNEADCLADKEKCHCGEANIDTAKKKRQRKALA